MQIADGPISQIAWVVEDLDAFERHLGEHFGVRGWARLTDVHFGPEACTYRGEPADFVIDVSLAYAGDLQLEVIRPVRGRSIYTDFLDAAAPGLHHLCFEVDDMSAALRAADASGLDVCQAGTMADGDLSFAYIDGSGWGAPYVEIVQVGGLMRSFFAGIKAQSR